MCCTFSHLQAGCANEEELTTPKWDIMRYYEGPDDFAACLRYLPLDPCEASTDQVKDWLSQVIIGSVWHHHKATCKKNGCEGTDLSCRMAFKRLLVALSHAFKHPHTKELAGILLRRTQGNIVPYNRALMMAVPGNHMVSILCEMSRYVRDRYIWQVAKDAGKEVSGAYL